MKTIGFLALAAALALGGCSLGRMEVDEVYYLKLTNGTDSAYTRVTVKGSTFLSDSKYRSGWFPSEAVDTVLGNVGDDTTGKTRAARDEMRDQLIDAMKQAHENFLAVALKPDASEAEIRQALQSWARTRLAPIGDDPDVEGAIIVEYNPAQGLETFRSDEKLIFVLSANPDTVIRSISQIANDNETKAAIQRFTNVIVEQAKADVEAKKATADVAAKADVFLAGQVDAVAQAMDSKANRDAVVRQTEALISLLRGVDGAGRQP
jgi:hypothetical protein